MRSVPVPVSEDSGNFPVIELTQLFEPMSDYFLTDTLITGGKQQIAQPVCGFVGITGKTCNWKTAAQLVEATQVPVILAGGLSQDNVCQAIQAVKPAGVDSCTLTNAVDHKGQAIRFRKDMTKVREFIVQVRRATAIELN